jgi:diguanylate cyclase (GGDEF)-like protein
MWGTVIRSWRWLVLVSLLATTTPAWAVPGSGHVKSVPLTVCVAKGTAPLNAVLAPGGPQFDCTPGQQRFGGGDFWIRTASLPPDTGLRLDRVRYGSPWQGRSALYARYADGSIAALPIVPGHEGALMQPGATIEQILPHRGSRVTDLFWRIEESPNIRGILAAPTLLSTDAAIATNMRSAALYAAFAGLCLALLIYNLALWVAVRHRFQLAYCAMVATLLCYATTASGALMWWWPSLANNDRLRISYVTLAASGAAAIWFARTFFEPRIFAGWLGRLSTAVALAILGSALLFACLAPTGMYVLDRLHGATFAAQLLLTVPILGAAMRRGSSFTVPFAFAWSGSAMMAGIRVCNTFQLLPAMIAIGQNVVALMTAEVLLSSLAIAYRIHLLGRERDEARTQEIAARLLADTDPLTGLMNRRSFLAQAIGRQGAQLLLIVDLDHFKAINETIGHDGGDEVLRLISRALQRALPVGTLIARIGGEEFAIVAAVDAGVSPRLVVDALRCQRMPYDLTVTASIGTCTGPLAQAADWKQLYRQADRALYAAKAAGRDRVRDAGMLPLAA